MVYTEYFASGTEPTDNVRRCTAIARHPRPRRRVLRRQRKPPSRSRRWTSAVVTGAAHRAGVPRSRRRAGRASQPPSRPAAPRSAGSGRAVFGDAAGTTKARRERDERRIRTEAQKPGVLGSALAFARFMPFRDVIGHRRLIALLARAIAAERCRPACSSRARRRRQTSTAVALARRSTAPTSAAAVATTGRDRRSRSTRAGRARVPPHRPRRPSRRADRSSRARRAPSRSTRSATSSTEAGYRPFEGRRRVVIIDDADALEPSAQNALLKTLEEPPPASMFVLVTARPDCCCSTRALAVPAVSLRAARRRRSRARC